MSVWFYLKAKPFVRKWWKCIYYSLSSLIALCTKVNTRRSALLTSFHTGMERHQWTKSHKSEDLFQGLPHAVWHCICQHNSSGLINLKHKGWQHCFCLFPLQYEVIWFSFMLLNAKVWWKVLPVCYFTFILCCVHV